MSKPEIVAIAPLPAFFAKPLHENFTVHDLHGAADAEARRALIAKIAPTTRGMVAFGGSQLAPDQLAKFPHLEIISVFGVGYDGMPLAACAEAKVKVTNTPDVLNDEVADTAVALTLMTCRQFVGAHKFVEAGDWLKGQYPLTHSLWGKTVGIIGLGRIGKLVAQRSLAFGMKLVAYDPFVSEEAARRMSVELLTLDELIARADFITLHLAKTPETIGLIGKDLLAKAKPNLRVVNVARGGIVDEQALADAIRSGQVAGAAIDVFDKEPCLDSPLFELDEVVVTPHLGASTVEAQDKAGDTIADMVELALAGEFVPFAVNVSAGEVSETVRPYQALAEKLGGMLAGLSAGVPQESIEISYDGQIAEYDTRILTLSVLKGFFGAVGGDPVSYVNAPQLATEHGIEVRPSQSTTPKDYVNLITVRCGDHGVAGTLAGLNSVPKIVMIDDFTLDRQPVSFDLP